MARCKHYVEAFDCCAKTSEFLEGTIELHSCNYTDSAEPNCRYFEAKADVVEVETIKSWLYEMALNNVGCHIEGDFSNACEEIISRLDGLRTYASERRCEE